MANWDARPINAGSTATLLRAPDWPFAQAEMSTERIELNRRLFWISERGLRWEFGGVQRDFN